MKRQPVIPDQECPNCHAELNAADPLSEPDSVPRPGDWSICYECRGVFVFDDQLRTRVPTVDDILDLDADQQQTVAMMMQWAQLMNEMERE